MKIFFKTRTEMRNSKINAKKVDNGNSAPIGKRWSVDFSENFKNK